MRTDSAIFAVSGKFEHAQNAIAAWTGSAAKLDALGVNTVRRSASVIGQCAHESAHLKSLSENLNYSADGLASTFKIHFTDANDRAAYARQPEKIANRVYGGRMGNGDEASGEGWKYRGRGYLQLTGKENYQVYGDLLGLDLEADPNLAARPENAWLIAAQFYARVRRNGKNLLEWADVPDHEQVTRGINGGINGLADRIILTKAARDALEGDVPVMEQQLLLTEAGFDPKGIDGKTGSNTKKAIAAAEASLVFLATHFGRP